MIQTDLTQAGGGLMVGHTASTLVLSYLQEQLDLGLKFTSHESADKMARITHEKRLIIHQFAHYKKT